MAEDAGQPRAAAISVGVVNDFEIVVAGLATLLEACRPSVSVRRYSDRTPAPGEVDVVLFDAFGRAGGIERVRELVVACGSPVLLFTWAYDGEQADRARRAGAMGVVTKSATAEQVHAAILSASRGQWTAAPAASTAPTMREWPGQELGLTAREADVVALIVAGLNNQQIAHSLWLSINSVKTYIRTAYRTMGVDSRTQAVIWGIDHGFRPDQPHVATRPANGTGHHPHG